MKTLTLFFLTFLFTYSAYASTSKCEINMGAYSNQLENPSLKDKEFDGIEGITYGSKLNIKYLITITGIRDRGTCAKIAALYFNAQKGSATVSYKHTAVDEGIIQGQNP